jgi:Lactonase, 7-bladed beta-propeller
MGAKFLRFGIRAALVSAIALIVCRIAIAAPAKTTKNLYTQTPDGDLASYRINADGALSLTGRLKVVWQHDPGSRDMPNSIELAVPPGSSFAYASDPSGRAVNLICYPIAQDNGALQPNGTCDSGQPIHHALSASPGGVLFGVDDRDGEVRPYAIDRSGGRLTPAGVPIPSSSSEQTPPLAAFGKYVYVVCEACNNVRSLQFTRDSSGERAVLINQVPTGTRPDAIALDPDHQFAYVANAADSSISEYYIDPASRALRPNPKAQTATLHAEPFNLVIDPTGRFLYALGSLKRTTREWPNSDEMATSEVIDQFRIASDGTLESVGEPIKPFHGASDFSPNGTMLADPSGRFIYVTGSVPNEDRSASSRRIEGFRITSSGRLDALKSPSVPIFYDTNAVISWTGPRPIVAAVKRDVTPLLALKSPLEDAFTQAGLLTARALPGSYIYPNLLPDGLVFFLEKDPWANIRGEIYDPARAAVTNLGIIVPRNDAPIVIATLTGGKYLLRFWKPDQHAAIFDPKTMRSSPKGHLPERCYRDYWLLNDGRVLFARIKLNDLKGAVTPPCGGEIYDPATGKSTELPPALNKIFLQVFAKLADDELLLRMNSFYWDWWKKGGPNELPGKVDPFFKEYDPQKVSIFDLKTGKSKPAARMPERLVNLTSVTLKDGTVFIVGDTEDSPARVGASRVARNCTTLRPAPSSNSGRSFKRAGAAHSRF